ncbi:MAG: DUF4271 domain-containing protein [Bacteroidia bacterium]|nr:DUF4271 domain-containing protein [Bacteroidia bacterium]
MAEGNRTAVSLIQTKHPFEPDKGILSPFADAEKFTGERSLHPGTSVPRAPEYVNLFQGHELKVIHKDPVPRNHIVPDWIFIVVLLVIGIYTWLRIYYSRYFGQLIRAFVNFNLANQIVRDENILIQRASVFLSFTFHVVIALLLYQISIHQGWSLGGTGTGFMRFFYLLVLVTLIYAMKFLVLKLCGWLFDLDREMAVYTFIIFLVNNLLGLALIPVVILIAYNQIIPATFLIPAGLVLASLAFLYRLVKGIQVGTGVPGYSPLYLFLYLCTLEIAPLLILIKLVN